MHSAVWNVERREATVAELHGLGIPEDPVRTVRIHRPANGAIVLGSAQPDSDVDHEAVRRHGLTIVRRASGGGAVLVQPADLVWIDVVVPRDDQLWRDDVGKAFSWLGAVWVQVLQCLDVRAVSMHEGAMVTTEWSRKICFAGLGPGEVLSNGRKLIGISQKRTRNGALFQASVLLRFDLERMIDVLALPSGATTRIKREVGDFVTALPLDVDEVERTFVDFVQNV